jgi:hypothetical protein
MFGSSFLSRTAGGGIQWDGFGSRFCGVSGIAVGDVKQKRKIKAAKTSAARRTLVFMASKKEQRVVG